MPPTAVQPQIEDNLEQLISPSLLRSFTADTSEKNRKRETLSDPLLRKKLERLARQLGNNREDAEDLAQKTLLRAFQNLDSFNIEQGPVNWCLKILVRQNIDLQRAKDRRIQAISADSMMYDTTIELIGNFPDPTTIEDQGASIVQFFAIQAEEFIKGVFADKPEHLEIFLLRAEGKSYEEIQEISAYPASILALRKRSFKATKKLEQAIQEIDLQYEDLLNRFHIGR